MTDVEPLVSELDATLARYLRQRVDEVDLQRVADECAVAVSAHLPAGAPFQLAVTMRYGPGPDQTCDFILTQNGASVL